MKAKVELAMALIKHAEDSAGCCRTCGWDRKEHHPECVVLKAKQIVEDHESHSW